MHGETVNFAVCNVFSFATIYLCSNKCKLTLIKGVYKESEECACITQVLHSCFFAAVILHISIRNQSPKHSVHVETRRLGSMK